MMMMIYASPVAKGLTTLGPCIETADGDSLQFTLVKCPQKLVSTLEQTFTLAYLGTILLFRFSK